MKNISPLIRPCVQKMQAYCSAQSNGTKNCQTILNANENPFQTEYNRYPQSIPQTLQQAYANYLLSNYKVKVRTENILFSNGSDEAIDLLIRAFCEPEKDSICITSPAFSMYEHWAYVSNILIKDIPLEGENLDKLNTLKILETNAKITFLCNPNNPVATSLSQQQIEEVCKHSAGIVVVDEAYGEFFEENSFLLLKKYKNLVILRTFSKAWGLAALRAGVIIADTEIIKVLQKIKAPYNVNTYTQKQCLEALANSEKMKKEVKNLNQEKIQLAKELSNLTCVQKVFPSVANFLLVEFNNSKKADGILIENGILVRNQSSKIKNCLRITVGTKQENKKVLAVLKNINK